MTTQVYEVPVLFTGMRQPEAYLQIIDLLDNLNHVIDDTYSRIRVRVTHERARIDNLSSRLVVAQSKVQQITGSSSKAITVFSSAKYPTSIPPSDYVPLYADAHKKRPKFSAYHLRDVPHIQTDSEDSLDTSELLFLEKASAESRLEEIGGVQEGLGRLPHRIPSVSSLLLFNSSETPYKKYMTTDNLAGRDNTADSRKILRKEIGAAPESVTKGVQMNRAEGIEYGYMPGFVDVPTFNFPGVLPDLPGVADIAWSGASSSDGIAPSQHLKLPNFEATGNVSVSTTAAPATPVPGPTTTPNPSAPPPPPSNAPPPPPPPGPPPPPPPSNAPPPPPPPGPPGPPPPSLAASLGDLPSSDDARSGLMDAIRNFKGGLKKKSEGDGKKEKAKKAAPPPKSSDDMFGALLQAVGRRRQAMAAKKPKDGKQAKKQEDEEIRAPPKEGNKEADDDDEDDDDDDKNWDD